jgi:hypothetical protein
MSTRSWLTAALCSAAALGCAPEMAASAPPNQPPAGSNTPPAAGSTTPTAGSSAPHATAPRLTATALSGPHATLEAACTAGLQAAGLPKPAAPCRATPIALGAGATFGAALLRAEDTSDPRYAGSGAFFLAVGHEGAWFVVPKPLDQINGAAGHMYLPVVSAEAATLDGTARALIRLRDATSSVCNTCEGAARDVKTPVQAKLLLAVCGKDAAGKPACSAPVEAEDGAKATLANGMLTIVLDAKAKRLEVAF